MEDYSIFSVVSEIGILSSILSQPIYPFGFHDLPGFNRSLRAERESDLFWFGLPSLQR